MILDSLLVWDSARAASGFTVSTQDSTNIIDLAATGQIPVLAAGQGARDLGVGDNPALKINVQVATALTSGGASTLQVAIQGAPDNGSGAPGAWTIYAQSSVYALATLAVVGANLLPIDLPRPPAGAPLPRFLKLTYTVGTAVFTGGTIYAELVLDRQDWITYPAGLVINN